jgi:hypothetical protein
MLDARSLAPMPAPRSVAYDPIARKHRRDKLRDAAVPTVGEHSPVKFAKGLDGRPSVVNRIVAISTTTRGGRHDA